MELLVEVAAAPPLALAPGSVKSIDMDETLSTGPDIFLSRTKTSKSVNIFTIVAPAADLYDSKWARYS